ncbi:retrovirus-related pol polyprotein from transposon tnt 1-94, partial [Nicotiana attenuata]
TSNITQVIQFHPSSQLPIKLSGSTNFTTWKAQYFTLMCGHDLMSFLDDTSTSPPKRITKDNKEIANPEYKLWFRQDSLIRNALMASVDATIAPSIAAAETSQQAWEMLHTTYANKSQTRIYSLRDLLAKTTRDSKSVSDYLREIRSLADELATAGAPISNAELVVEILSGLGHEYREISAAIRARDTPISYEELLDKLSDHELFLKHEELKKNTLSITANVAQKGSNNHTLDRNSNKRWNNLQPQAQRMNNLSVSRPPYWRQNFQSNPHGRVQCQLCGKYGHTANVCRSRSHNHNEAKALLATRQGQQNNNPWVLDTGASHHITADSHNLMPPLDYTGTEEICMGDGNGIPITHTGSSTLFTPTKDFYLHNILCAPHIKRNLISVSKFCNQNRTSIEFFLSFFVVKEL